MLIALTGYARSGKDTVGRILVEKHGFRRVAFGDVLKRVAEDMDPILVRRIEAPEPVGTEIFHMSVGEALETLGGWEAVKDEVPEARQWLVDLGNSLRRHIKGIEVSAALAGVDIKGEDVVVTNVYHPEEIDQFLELGGLVMRVQRPGVGPANADEAATGRHPVSGEIQNAGSIEDLEAQVTDLVEQLRSVPF